MLGPDPYDLPSANPSEPHAPPSGTASGGQLAWLGFGMVLFFILFVLPLWLLAWAAGALLGTWKIAHLLRETHGLEPTTYGGAFWIAVLFILVMVVVELVAVFRPKDKRPGCLVALFTRPSLACLLLYLPTRVLVGIDKAGTDIPDVLTTFLLLCSLGYVYVILPVPLFALSLRAWRKLWQVGKASQFRAGVFGTLGLALAAVVPLVCTTNEQVEETTEALAEIDADDVSLALKAGSVTFADTPAEASRRVIAGIAEVDLRNPKNRGARLGIGRKDLFDGCIEELSRPPGESAPRPRVERSLMKNQRLDRSLANDIVSQKILHVCLQHSNTPIDELLPYLFKAAKNATMTHFERHKTRRACLIARPRPAYSSTNPYPAKDRFIDFTRAFCRLSGEDQELLLLKADGETSDAIGRQLKLTPGTVRKRKQRRLEELNEVVYGR